MKNGGSFHSYVKLPEGQFLDLSIERWLYKEGDFPSHVGILSDGVSQVSVQSAFPGQFWAFVTYRVDDGITSLGFKGLWMVMVRILMGFDRDLRGIYDLMGL